MSSGGRTVDMKLLIVIARGEKRERGAKRIERERSRRGKSEAEDDYNVTRWESFRVGSTISRGSRS